MVLALSLSLLLVFFLAFFCFTLLQIFGIPGPIRSSAPSSARRERPLPRTSVLPLPEAKAPPPPEAEVSYPPSQQTRQHQPHAFTSGPSAKHSSIPRTLLTGKNLCSNGVPMEVSTSGQSQYRRTCFWEHFLSCTRYPAILDDWKILDNSKIAEKNPSHPSISARIGCGGGVPVLLAVRWT